MARFSGWLIQNSKGWLVLICTVVFVLFMIFVLPNQSEKAEEYNAGGMSPDTSFYYTPGQLFEMAEAYGDAGRQAYVQARFSFDLIFPLVYGIFLVTTTSWLLEKVLRSGSHWRQLNLVPVIGVVFDFLENISTSLVMLGYPEQRAAAAQLAPIFTLLKWVFVNGSFLVLLVFLGVWIYHKVRRES
jgi:hypothetical protein